MVARQRSGQPGFLRRVVRVTPGSRRYRPGLGVLPLADSGRNLAIQVANRWPSSACAAVMTAVGSSAAGRPRCCCSQASTPRGPGGAHSPRPEGSTPRPARPKSRSHSRGAATAPAGRGRRRTRRPRHRTRRPARWPGPARSSSATGRTPNRSHWPARRESGDRGTRAPSTSRPPGQRCRRRWPGRTHRHSPRPRPVLQVPEQVELRHRRVLEIRIAGLSDPMAVPSYHRLPSLGHATRGARYARRGGQQVGRKPPLGGGRRRAVADVHSIRSPWTKVPSREMSPDWW